MKNNILRFFASLFFAIISITSKGQNDEGIIYGYDYLGTHCYITVYINRDPVTSDGYLKYTINVPPEGAVYTQGPAGSYLLNNTGDTIDFYVRKGQLDMAADGMNCEIPFELWVNKWVDGFRYNTDGVGERCYYMIILMVNYD